MILDDDGFIYYLTKYQGHYFIKEINPSADHTHQHLVIFELKSEHCYAFSKDSKFFYFIDDTKTLIKLIRSDESRILKEGEHYVMKDKDRPNFLKKKRYGDIIVNSEYIIQKSNIFYV